MINRWDTIIGHDWAVQLLTTAIEHNRVGHAYLITGPEQIGKMTLARTFAQALNCQAPSAIERPCGQCRHCKLIASDRHPDVRVVEPELSARGKKTLKIEPIRDLQHDLSLAAYEGRYKVAIIREFDAANLNAANAFLKTLEEPPNHVVLLLTATDADTLLATITSRCRTVGLRPLPTSLIETSLQQRWQLPADEANLLAHLADGRMGWAVRACEDSSILEAREKRLEQLFEALAGDRVNRFDLADQLARKPEAVPDMLRRWLSWWRDVTMLTHQEKQGRSGQLQISNIDHKAYLERMARTWTTAQALTSFKQTNQAIWQIERNANTRLVLENLLLTFPYQSR